MGKYINDDNIKFWAEISSKLLYSLTDFNVNQIPSISIRTTATIDKFNWLE